MSEARTFEYYRREYEELERSPIDIANEWGTYPNKIRRELKKFGYQPRNKSKAQSLAIKSGRHPHPTKGMKRPKDVKEKISEAMGKSWQSVSKEERESRSDAAKLQWESMSEKERARFRKLAARAVRKSSKKGSKLEKFLFKSLRDEDYNVEFHATHILPNETLHTDLYIPELKTVIEIDGPSHYIAIWGEEALKKVERSDKKKNNQLMLYGFNIIRVKNMTKNLSDVRQRRTLENLLKELTKIKSGETQGLIFIEVNNA